MRAPLWTGTLRWLKPLAVLTAAVKLIRDVSAVAQTPIGGDLDELRDATNKAAQSFDAFFDSVGASEIELAMDAVRRRDRVREIVPLRDG